MFKQVFLGVFFIPLLLQGQQALISGEDTICSNGNKATVYIDFQNRGVPPYRFAYSINGAVQSHDTITTSLNVYEIKTKTEARKSINESAKEPNKETEEVVVQP